MVKVYETMIKHTATRILELQQQIKQLDKKLEALGENIEDVQYLISLPGCGVKLASRLIGEIQSIFHFESHNQLAVYLGIACVDQQSGKTDYAKPVFPANSVGKHAIMCLANLMVRNDSESKKYYQKKRAEGNDHSDALRRTARQIVKEKCVKFPANCIDSRFQHIIQNIIFTAPELIGPELVKQLANYTFIQFSKRIAIKKVFPQKLVFILAGLTPVALLGFNIFFKVLNNRI